MDQLKTLNIQKGYLIGVFYFSKLMPRTFFGQFWLKTFQMLYQFKINATVAFYYKKIAHFLRFSICSFLIFFLSNLDLTRIDLFVFFFSKFRDSLHFLILLFTMRSVTSWNLPRTIWLKVFQNEPSNICGRQPLKNLKWYDLLMLLSSRNFIGPFLNTLTHIT